MIEHPPPNWSSRSECSGVGRFGHTVGGICAIYARRRYSCFPIGLFEDALCVSTLQ